DADCRFWGTPDEANKLMRALYAEFGKRAKLHRATVDDAGQPSKDGPVKKWKLSYADGPQEGAISTTLSEGVESVGVEPMGAKLKAGQLLYTLKIRMKEAPKSKN